MARFLDTHVIMRSFANDSPTKARAALALMHRVEHGDERLVTTPPIIFEAVFLVQRSYKLPKERVREMVGDLLALRHLQLAEKRTCRLALDLCVERNIPYADAYNALWMLERAVADVYSWDAEFDRVPELRRLEPAEER